MTARFLVMIVTTGCAAFAAAQSNNGVPPPESARNFADVKAHHMARLQKELNCVEAATSFDEMRECSPRPPGGPMGPPPGAPQP